MVKLVALEIFYIFNEKGMLLEIFYRFQIFFDIFEKIYK